MSIETFEDFMKTKYEHRPSNEDGFYKVHRSIWDHQQKRINNRDKALGIKKKLLEIAKTTPYSLDQLMDALESVNSFAMSLNCSADGAINIIKKLGEKDEFLLTTKKLVLKSVPELMKEGWFFNSKGLLSHKSYPSVPGYITSYLGKEVEKDANWASYLTKMTEEDN